MQFGHADLAGGRDDVVQEPFVCPQRVDVILLEITTRLVVNRVDILERDLRALRAIDTPSRFLE